MEVFVGADYRGFALKNELLKFLTVNGYSATDEGAFEYVEGDDFNDPATKVALSVRENPGSRGILICGSGYGMCMQANRFRGIRAAWANAVEPIALARKSDDVNVLCLPADFVDLETAAAVAWAFLNTEFEALDRRVRRMEKLDTGEGY